MKSSTLPNPNPDPEQIVRDLLDWAEIESVKMREAGHLPNANDWDKLYNRVMRLDAVMSQFSKIRRRRAAHAFLLLILGASLLLVGIFGDLPWVLVTAALAILLAAAVWISLV
jgi:hypothetical protein